MNKLAQYICRHNSGVTIVKEAIFSEGAYLDERRKYIKCSRCGKILIDNETLLEYTTIQEDGE